MSILMQKLAMTAMMLFMPDYPTPRPASHNYTRNVTIGFCDHLGNTASLRIEGIDPTVTGGEVDALRAAAGALSNGGVISDKLEDDTEMAIIDALTFIDPFSEVSDKGVFRFDHPNNNFKSLYLEIPAIWADKVVAGGRAINTDDAAVTTFVNAALAVLNKVQIGGGDYYLGKAFYSDRKGKSGKADVRPNTRDPRNPV